MLIALLCAGSFALGVIVALVFCRWAIEVYSEEMSLDELYELERKLAGEIYEREVMGDE